MQICILLANYLYGGDPDRFLNSSNAMSDNGLSSCSTSFSSNESVLVLTKPSDISKHKAEFVEKIKTYLPLNDADYVLQKIAEAQTFESLNIIENKDLHPVTLIEQMAQRIENTYLYGFQSSSEEKLRRLELWHKKFLLKLVNFKTQANNIIVLSQSSDAEAREKYFNLLGKLRKFESICCQLINS